MEQVDVGRGDGDGQDDIEGDIRMINTAWVTESMRNLGGGATGACGSKPPTKNLKASLCHQSEVESHDNS